MHSQILCHPERGLFFARQAQRTTTVEGSLSHRQNRKLRKASSSRPYAFTTCLGSSVVAAAFLPSFGSQLIMPRSFAPTISIGCCFSFSRSALNLRPPLLFSAIHSRANSPL